MAADVASTVCDCVHGAKKNGLVCANKQVLLNCFWNSKR